LETNRTPFNHSRKACQWMRAITAAVIQGYSTNAAARRAEVSGRDRPETEVTSSLPAGSS
jgi:hypothetical protein